MSTHDRKLQTYVEFKSLKNSPIEVSDIKSYYNHKQLKTNQGYDIKITNYQNCDNVEFKFLYNGYESCASCDCILRGEVRNPFHMRKCGGYIGVGPYNYINSDHEYNIWSAMLERTHIETQLKFKNMNPYIGTKLNDKWRNFQTFAAWYKNYSSFLNIKYLYDYQLDKDILQWGNPIKEYGPYTCCLIPSKLNLKLATMQYVYEKEIPCRLSKNDNGTYSSYVEISNNKGREVISIGEFDSIEEAVIRYRIYKCNDLLNLINEYIEDDRILPEIYFAVGKIAYGILPENLRRYFLDEFE